MTDLIYYQFGSENSQDVDLLVLVSQLGLIKTNKKRVEAIEKKLQENYQKELNVNLGVLRDGKIDEVFKGTPDEVNNSVFLTYDLHPQKFSLKIDSLVKRDVDLKIVRTLRIILSFLSRTKKRPEVKQALKMNVKDQILFLNKEDLSEYRTKENLGKMAVSLEDYYKNMAFQLGQTMSLIKNKEIFTKNDLAREYPKLEPLLMRKDGNDFSLILEEYKREFLALIVDMELKYKKEPRRK